jgi:hypothetical protein
MAQFSSLEDQIRECFGRLVYTHKTHEKMAQQCSDTLRRNKIVQIVLSALTSSGVVSILFIDKFSLKLATAVVSFLSVCLSTYLKSFDPGGSAQKHRDAAANLWPIRESYLSLLTDLRMQAITNEQAIARREELQKKLAAVYKGAPQTNGKAYAAAQTALKQNEEFTFSDSEIDKFLPASLRKSNG